MNLTILHRLLILLAGCLFMYGCATSNQPGIKTPDPKTNDFYTSSFPTRDVSKELEKIQKSVKRISSTATYQTFFFENQLVTMDQIRVNDMKDLATESVADNQSTAGTAIVIAGNNRKVMLITCAHVIDFPDTLITYFDSDNLSPKTFVKSITIKRNQNNILYDLPNIGSISIIAEDFDTDLALLEVNLQNFKELNAPVIPIKAGNPKDLQLGSFIYILGYPKGNPMVTHGIVSNPNKTKKGHFLSDALFNHGISGGLILATRDNFHSFEWIAMANTASANQESLLVPNPGQIENYEPFEPYSGNIYVGKKTFISYGITQCIPMEVIQDFLKENQSAFKKNGLHY